MLSFCFGLLYSVDNSVSYHCNSNQIRNHAPLTAAINALQVQISFWEICKARTAWIGGGKKILAIISIALLGFSLLPISDLNDDARIGNIFLAALIHAPRGLLTVQNWLIDREIGFLRNQIERLIEESSYVIC